MLNKNICLEKESAYKLIQQDIKTRINSGALTPGGKLLPENELTKVYNTNLYHVRSAIRNLKKENILNSVPKVGVFISSTAKGKESQHVTDNQKVPDNSFRQYQSVLSFMPTYPHREYAGAWQKIIESFMEQYPFYHIEANDNFCQGTGNNPDIKEYGNLAHQKYDMPLLNLKPFFRHNQQVSSLLLDDFALPTYYNAGVLIFNKTRMKKLKLPLPEYSTYDGQIEYLDEMVSGGQRNNYAVPGTRHSPLLRMGHNLPLLVESIVNDEHIAEENIIAEFTPVLEKIIAFWRKYRISLPKKAAASFDEFAAEGSLMYMGFCDDIVRLKQRDVAFEWGAYPFFNLDGYLLKYPLIAALSQTTHFQVEGIRFLLHIQNLESQKLFAELGCIPTREDALSFNPYLGDEKFKNAIINGPVIFFKNPQMQYLCINIINIELWNCILHDKPCAEALNDSIMLGRAYLSNVLDAKLADQLAITASLYS
jgi:DNA-binding transcriptional regulator YhcF (GntR family)/ABC-type glycerol-3-phosphate transport system substrate-binding protein